MFMPQIDKISMNIQMHVFLEKGGPTNSSNRVAGGAREAHGGRNGSNSTALRENSNTPFPACLRQGAADSIAAAHSARQDLVNGTSGYLVRYYLFYLIDLFLMVVFDVCI